MIQQNEQARNCHAKRRWYGAPKAGEMLTCARCGLARYYTTSSAERAHKLRHASVLFVLMLKRR